MLVEDFIFVVPVVGSGNTNDVYGKIIKSLVSADKVGTVRGSSIEITTNDVMCFLRKSCQLPLNFTERVLVRVIPFELTRGVAWRNIGSDDVGVAVLVEKTAIQFGYNQIW